MITSLNECSGGGEQVGRQSRPATRLKVAFLIKALGAGPGGGAERILTLVSNELAERGHEVSVVSFDGAEDRDFYTVSPAIRRLRLGLGRTTARSDVVTTVRRLIGSRRAFLELKPEVAIGFMHSAFVPLSLALRGTGIPVIGSERTAFTHYRSRPLQRLLLRASVRLLKHMTVNGAEIRDEFPAAISERMTVIPNPVLPARRLAEPGGGEIRTLLCVGGLRPEKDHQTLLISFARVANRFPDWRLRIIGDGPLRKSLERKIEELGLGDRVQLVNARSSIEAEYSDAQLFVLPSTYEAFPNCLAEALAHGLPAVGFADCPGTNALIVPGVNGALAAGPDKVQALSTTLEGLMASPALRESLGQRAPTTVERYSLSATVDRWERLLRYAVRNS